MLVPLNTWQEFDEAETSFDTQPQLTEGSMCDKGGGGG